MLANSRGPPDRFQPYLFANRFGGRKMKKDPEKVFIRSKDGYEEITFEEFLNREASNEEYKKKKFVYLHGMLMEVSEEDYAEYYRHRRREKYIAERSTSNGDISYHMLTTDEFNGEDILVDEQADTAAQAEQEIMKDKLRCAMLKLDDDEKLLIYRHYYAEIPTTKLAKMYGISQQAVSKRIIKIREKLKNIMEK